MDYKDIKEGDVLEKGDEYSCGNGGWISIPEFMIGDIIPSNDHTKWRRPIVTKKEVEKRFSLFGFLKK